MSYFSPPPGSESRCACLYIEGRMGWMGWMGWDGMVGPLFFSGPYLENYFIIFVNCFSSLKYMCLHIFWNIGRKISECSIFENISPKSTTFFSKIFKRISQFSRKLLNIFSSLCLVLLTEGWDGMDGVDGVVGPLFFLPIS